jgi:hypothetical protein
MAPVLPTMGTLHDQTSFNIKQNITESCSRETWIEIQKLLASDGEQGDYFGYSISLFGDTALIGAYWSNDDKGSAYIFTHTGTTWTQQAKLTASDGVAEDQFGISVSLYENTALIGAYACNGGTGASYVFTRTGTTWMEQQKLTASDGQVDDYFGGSVSLFNDTALIGAFVWNGGAGAAYVFTRTGTIWSQQQKLTASPPELEWFGCSVSLYGNTALIGAVGTWTANGAAYVFTRTGTTWAFEQKLLASDGAEDDNFGYSVALYGDTALVGAYGDDDNGDESGSTYVFSRTETTWAQQDKLLASDGEAGDSFGWFVSLDGDTALISAYWSENGKGSAYVFTRSGTTWAQQQKLTASDGVRPDWFGWSFSLSGDTALIGAFYKDSGTGAVYVFINGQAPVANFSWTPQEPISNQPIFFNASTSYDPDGTIILYEWDWNNDGVYEEVNPTPLATHTWESTGNYSVRVRVTDNVGITGAITKTVSVSEAINLALYISGGLGVKVEITNNGTSDVNDVPWQIHIQGGILGMINKTINGTDDIPAGKTVTVTTGILFGFGPISINAKVADKEQAATGIQLIILSMVRK